MASTRVRFTLSYVGLSMGAVIAFAIVLYFSRLSLARAQVYDQALLFADNIIRDIQLSRERGYPLMVVDSTEPGSLRISPQISQFLDLRPGYFILVDSVGNVLYNSPQVRALPATDGDSLLQYTSRISPQILAKVPLFADSLNRHYLWLLARRAGPGLEPFISRAVVGVPDQFTQLSGELLLGTMFVLLPFILAAAAGAAWFMADGVFAPMHQL